MTINDIVNKDGSLNYGTIGGFKDRLDGHDSSLASGTLLDNYSTVVTRDSNGNVTQTQLMNGVTVIQTTTITRDSNGNVTSIAETLNGKTVTTTINRASDGTVSSTSKAVV